MPLTHFRCPDNEVVEISECLSKCRMASRCLTLPTLATIAGGKREWSGKPSTTQLLNGTMQEYLKIKRVYAVTPSSQAFSLLGTRHHEKLEQTNVPGSEQEIQLGSDQSISGIADLVAPSEDKPGYHDIIDYKTFGSYRVKMMLGIVKRLVPSKTERYKRATTAGGRQHRVGDPKMINEFHRDPKAVEDFNEVMQLNNYRVLAEASGFKIDKMELQITVRDGGTLSARSNGIYENIYYPIPIRRVNDAEVAAYFEAKRGQLVHAVENDTMPEVCTDEENWDGRKCESYCDVAAFCPKGSALVKLEDRRSVPDNLRLLGT